MKWLNALLLQHEAVVLGKRNEKNSFLGPLLLVE